MTEISSMPRVKLAPDYEISRVIRGGWQLATGHGQLRGADPVGDMIAFADAGITTFNWRADTAPWRGTLYLTTCKPSWTPG